MKQLLFMALAACMLPGCKKDVKVVAQQRAVTGDSVRAVGGGCDGCELMYTGMPERIAAVDTSAGWHEKGKRLLVKGTVYQRDGKTPAPNTIIYYWHTDSKGYYSPAPGMDREAERHGHLRGWLKTGIDGRYALYTIRPAAYPGTQNPEHIHIAVKEPGLSEYYIDEWVFDDDPFFTADYRKQLPNRGGSGILKVKQQGGLQVAEQDIVLGLNIPGH